VTLPRPGRCWALTFENFVQGVGKLAEFLMTDERIMRLDLSYNRMGEHGAKVMADMLTVNTRLFHLYLTGNKVGDIGGLALAKV
jgi:Ran GTPase-activating protein (RanGAP) involved in mRNA processing and transport